MIREVDKLKNQRIQVEIKMKSFEDQVRDLGKEKVEIKKHVNYGKEVEMKIRLQKAKIERNKKSIIGE